MIYFIGQKDKVKIGYSKDVKQRIKTLSTSSPLPLILLGCIEGNKILEKDLHRKFHNYKLCREWFSWSEEIQDYINENTITNTYCEIENGLVKAYKKMKI